MYDFPELLKRIRKESGLTQEELARVLDVSTVLISMLETGQKEVSKIFINKLASRLDVHPATIAPFAFEGSSSDASSALERSLIQLGEKLQIFLVEKKSKNLKHYV